MSASRPSPRLVSSPRPRPRRCRDSILRVEGRGGAATHLFCASKAAASPRLVSASKAAARLFSASKAAARRFSASKAAASPRFYSPRPRPRRRRDQNVRAANVPQPRFVVFALLQPRIQIKVRRQLVVVDGRGVDDGRAEVLVLHRRETPFLGLLGVCCCGEARYFHRREVVELRPERIPDVRALRRQYLRNTSSTTYGTKHDARLPTLRETATPARRRCEILPKRTSPLTRKRFRRRRTTEPHSRSARSWAGLGSGNNWSFPMNVRFSSSRRNRALRGSAPPTDRPDGDAARSDRNDPIFVRARVVLDPGRWPVDDACSARVCRQSARNASRLPASRVDASFGDAALGSSK